MGKYNHLDAGHDIVLAERRFKRAKKCLEDASDRSINIEDRLIAISYAVSDLVKVKSRLDRIEAYERGTSKHELMELLRSKKLKVKDKETLIESILMEMNSIPKLRKAIDRFKKTDGKDIIWHEWG